MCRLTCRYFLRQTLHCKPELYREPPTHPSLPGLCIDGALELSVRLLALSPCPGEGMLHLYKGQRENDNNCNPSLLLCSKHELTFSTKIAQSVKVEKKLCLVSKKSYVYSKVIWEISFQSGNACTLLLRVFNQNVFLGFFGNYLRSASPPDCGLTFGSDSLTLVTYRPLVGSTLHLPVFVDLIVDLIICIAL